MGSYLVGILIGMLIYSFILTVVTIYKDNSSYFMVGDLDIIVAGPLMWIILIIGYLFVRPFYSLIKEKNKSKKPKVYKQKSKKYIQKVVKKIVSNYSNKKYHNDYFDLERYLDSYDNDYCGYGSLLVKKAKNEWVNKKFDILMNKQKEETLEELKKHFVLVTEEIMKNDDCCEYFINEYKNKTLYKLKSNINS